MECILLHMAGPIGHVVYAQKVYGSLDQGLDKASFIIGTLFPDIRALGVISREKTHPTSVTYAHVMQEKDAFTTGLLLHALIDEVREEYVVAHGVYEELPAGYLTTIALKVCEDIALHGKLNDWATYSRYLGAVLPGEEAMGVDADTIRTWHALLIQYFADISQKGAGIYLDGIGWRKKDLNQIMQTVQTIQKRKLVEDYIFNFYNELESLLQASKK